MSEMIKTMSVIPLRGLTVLPTMVLHFDISRDKSIKAVEAAMAEDQILFLATQQNPDDNNPGLRGLYETGVTARIRNVAKLPKDIVRVMVEGLQKGRILELQEQNDYLQAQIEPIEEDSLVMDPLVADGMTRALEDLLQRYGQLNPKFGKDMLKQLMEIRDFEKLTMAVCVHLPLSYVQRQKLLEAGNMAERYDRLSVILVNEMEIMQVRNEIQQRVKERVDKNQRDYVLREQIKIIQEELGEDTLLSDVRNYQEAAERLCASDEVKAKIRKETEQLKSVGNNSAESSVLRGHIETLLEMPWDKTSVDNQDLKNAEKILNEDHYGLEKVKERVLEFLAVRCLNEKGISPILCLVGPPGTGKTSIARSVARALDKKYVRISLGGVRDEAEIRGHRRTYIGAMPGRIAAGMRQAGVKNPLMLLDEIDKVSSDYKGDCFSALLEVLDTEQNCRFRDHYVELPLDLSQVLFIATANDLHTIPRPLLDRMEVIEVSSYTANEKLHIAREHLVAKQIQRHGLAKGQLTITKSALLSIISGYTKEAGVRQLERKIGEICRKAARQVLEEKEEAGKQKEKKNGDSQKEQKSIRVSDKNLEKYLGKKRYTFKKKNAKNDVGIVRGLAWTSVGGDTLQIEVNTMPGKGEFLLTGQLGDVMKESARTAISYIRSLGEEYKIAPEFFSKHDIHIHIPDGAVPKDGPSAGITMATAILSAITGTPVRADVAMTGEITLRGRVLPIGGLKEKLLAAKQAGIATVVVPSENRADIAEIQAEITDGLELVYAEAMPEVLRTALEQS